MVTKTLLNDYQQLDELTEQMWHLAKQQQWEPLLGLLGDYQGLVKRLHLADDRITMGFNEQQRQVISHHLSQILARQSQLSDMIALYQQTLSRHISTTVNRHKQIHSYQQVATWS